MTSRVSQPPKKTARPAKRPEQPAGPELKLFGETLKKIENGEDLSQHEEAQFLEAFRTELPPGDKRRMYMQLEQAIEKGGRNVKHLNAVRAVTMKRTAALLLGEKTPGAIKKLEEGLAEDAKELEQVRAAVAQLGTSPTSADDKSKLASLQAHQAEVEGRQAQSQELLSVLKGLRTHKPLEDVGFSLEFGVNWNALGLVSASPQTALFVSQKNPKTAKRTAEPVAAFQVGGGIGVSANVKPYVGRKDGEWKTGAAKSGGAAGVSYTANYPWAEEMVSLDLPSVLPAVATAKDGFLKVSASLPVGALAIGVLNPVAGVIVGLLETASFGLPFPLFCVNVGIGVREPRLIPVSDWTSEKIQQVTHWAGEKAAPVVEKLKPVIEPVKNAINEKVVQPVVHEAKKLKDALPLPEPKTAAEPAK